MSSLSPCLVPSLRLAFLGLDVAERELLAKFSMFVSEAKEGLMAADKAHAAEFRTKFLRFMRDSVQARMKLRDQANRPSAVLSEFHLTEDSPTRCGWHTRRALPFCAGRERS